MRGMTSKIITGSIIGAAIGYYAISQMKPRERKRIMRRGRKILSSATNALEDINFLK